MQFGIIELYDVRDGGRNIFLRNEGGGQVLEELRVVIVAVGRQQHTGLNQHIELTHIAHHLGVQRLIDTAKPDFGDHW